MDVGQKRREQVARNVVEGVEGSDRIEGAGRQLELCEVRDDEARLRDRLARALDLARGDVDPGQREPPREARGLRRAAPAAELEHAGTAIKA